MQPININIPIRKSQRLVIKNMEKLDRFENLMNIGDSINISKYLNRKDDGRALGAVTPINKVLSIVIRTYKWKIPYSFGEFGNDNNSFNHPLGIVTDEIGQVLYICDSFNHRIQMYKIDGTFIKSWTIQTVQIGVGPTSITMYKDELYVVSKQNGKIIVFDKEGNFIREWGIRGFGFNELMNPFGITIYNDMVFITSSVKIKIFDLNGHFIRSFGSHGEQFDKFCGLTDIIISDIGEIYVCDSRNNRIQVLDIYGNFLRSLENWIITNKFNYFQVPEFITISPITNNIFITDYNNVHEFLQDGTFVKYIDLPKKVKESRCSGITISKCGDMIICDENNHSVYVFPAGY